ncbi:MAG TPA: FeoB-associated Cys-rich membrane protein [Pirellulales bacterium]|nr:FeoB-associated Cys-rich membrane protein [Pirellulales bacterium]
MNFDWQNINWQNIAALAIVAAAAVYVARVVYRMIFSAKPSCGGCGTCDASGSKSRPLVSLDPAPKQPGR